MSNVLIHNDGKLREGKYAKSVQKIFVQGGDKTAPEGTQTILQGGQVMLVVAIGVFQVSFKGISE